MSETQQNLGEISPPQTFMPEITGKRRPTISRKLGAPSTHEPDYD